MTTIPVKDANNITVDLEKPLAPGRAAAVASRPVVLSSEDFAALSAIAGGGGLTPGRKAASGSSPVVLSNEDLAALSNPAVGRKAAAASLPIVLSTEDLAALSAISGGGSSTVTIGDSAFSEYETVAASATDQALGATGATGDYLASLLIVPATLSPGPVSIKDGAGAAIQVFVGGASSVSNLVPFLAPLGIKSASGAWKVTTGASVSVIASGNFT